MGIKKHLRRQFKACLCQLFSEQQCWLLHEPAMSAMSGLLTLGPKIDEFAIASAIGVSAAESAGPQIVGNIAVLPIFGVLQPQATWLSRALGWTTYDQLRSDFSDARAKSEIKAIVLLVDSPGGSALGTEEAAQDIFNGRGSKPIYAISRGLNASAAYWLSSAADAIYAQPSSLTGSIGAISTHVEFTKALAADGITVTNVRSVPNKQLWNPYEKLEGNAKTTLQDLVSGVGAQFEAAVARQRGVSAGEVKSKFGQGNAYLAAEATSRGLVDGVMTVEQLLAQIQSGQLQASKSKVQSQGATLAPQASESTASGTVLPVAASGSPAAASAVSTPAVSAPLTTHHSPETPSVKISAKVRAAMFARGLISAQDADDAICIAALGAYFAARGEACPQNSEKTQLDDDKVVAGLFASSVIAATATTLAPPATAAAANVAAAHEREMAEARQQAAAGERERSAKLKASGKLLNLSAEAIDAAIASGKPLPEVLEAWHTDIAKREKPVTPGANVTITGEGADAFVADATLALQLRLDRLTAEDKPKVNDNVKRLARAPLAYFAQQCLSAAGTRVPEFAPPEELFEAAFAMDGGAHYNVGASYVPYNRPGSFPNLLSNLANKVLDAALELSEPTYDEWTGVWAGDLPDFKPAPIVNKGQHDELDEILDAEASKEFGIAEEILGAMMLKRFSNAFQLTPVMAANDDLNAFDEGLLGLEMAWQNTVNRACVRLLTGNAALLDGNNLYDSATHGNDITGGSGGVPSDAQWDLMQLKVAAQSGVGGKGFVRTPLKVALFPPALWRQATQSLGDFRVINETKIPTSDTNVNVYRGTVTLVREPELHNNSDAIWYGFAQPRGSYNATILRAYFRGWGKNGRRQRWYDPATKCWNFELEGRVGVAAKQYRLTVRNAGS